MSTWYTVARYEQSSETGVLSVLEGAGGMTNKYGAKRTWSQLCNRWFDSKLEATRGEELRLLEMAGEIRELAYQQCFVLSAKPKRTITIDFSYYDPRKTILIYEDAKGVMTRDFGTKLIWLKEKYGIEVEIYRG